MLTKEKIILTDADGVLFDWNSAFDEFMETEGFPKIPGTDHEYSIAARHGITHHQGQELVKKFNESWRVEHLKPFKDSVEYVTKLAQHGFRFVVVTSISDHPDAADRRRINLVNTFGDIFDDVQCLEQGASKHSALEQWSDSGFFWIEDHMRQAEAGHEVGLKTILINHPYNTHYSSDLFPRVSYDTPWKEIYDIVIRDYNLN